MLKNIFYILLFIFTWQAQAQEPAYLPEREEVLDSLNKDEDYFYFAGDTIRRTHIEITELVILPKIRFDEKKERRRYLILRRKTRKVYPYALIVSERLVKLQDRIAKIKSKNARRDYLKRVNDYVMEEFESDLRKLTRTEGQILMKLVHRQTGFTVDELLRDLKGNWDAWWWRKTAGAFNVHTDKKFNPMDDIEDFYIEDILLRSFQTGKLVEEKPHERIDYAPLARKWLPTIKRKGKPKPGDLVKDKN